MKKILFILLLLITINVKASSDLLQDVYIEDDGDVLIKQILNVHGTFNGFEINYDFSYAGEDSIYSSDNIEIIKVCEIDPNSFDNSTYLPINCFSKVNSASKGDSKKYVFSNKKLTMYNPSNTMNNKAFYIEFIMKNSIVKYDDIADLKLSIFDYGFNEEITTFKSRFHLPGKDSNFRIWGHGPLYGETDLIDDLTAIAQATYIPANTPIYIRLAFNRDLVPNSKKEINKTMFDNIINEETVSADEANEIRENARKKQEEYEKQQEEDRLKEKEKNKKDLRNFIGFSITWVLGLLGMFGYNYSKNNKLKEGTFNNEYFRDFPDDASPEEIRLLVENKQDALSLSSSLLNIIRKKGFKVEETTITTGLLIKKEEKDYRLTLVDHTLTEPLTSEEKYVRSWFIEFYGDANSFLLSSMKKRITNEIEARNFMKKFNNWKSKTKNILDQKSTYEKNTKFKTIASLYTFIPTILGIILLNPYIIFLSVLIVPLLLIILLSKRKTKEGIERTQKWKALKNFMSDFGRFGEKELPEIHLWEKYLVYANAFGIADKLKKQMEIKIQDINLTAQTPDIFNYMLLNNILNSSITSGVSSAVASASSTLSRVASSSNSSGGGFGGGFSGGGSFGGGGGMSGGRF